MMPWSAVYDFAANTYIILPPRFGPPQEAHISVSPAKTFGLSCHIVIVAVSHSRLWLRLSVGSRLGVNHDKM
jgi:hypothetical protein